MKTTLPFIIMLLCACSEDRMIYIEDIKTEYSAHAVAKYSETTCGFDVNMDYGCDTDYWSEQISESFYVNTHNGYLVNFYCDSNSISGYRCQPPTPAQYSAYTKQNFDRISISKDLKMHCWASVNEGELDFELTEEEYKFAIEHIGDSVWAEVGITVNLILE